MINHMTAKRGRKKIDFSKEFDGIACWMIGNKDDCFTEAVVKLGLLDKAHHQFKNKRDVMCRRWKKENKLYFLRQQIFNNGRAIAIVKPEVPTLGEVVLGSLDDDKLRKIGLVEIFKSLREIEERFRLIRQPLHITTLSTG